MPPRFVFIGEKRVPRPAKKVVVSFRQAEDHESLEDRKSGIDPR
jgi:hypothetical protein